LCFIAKKEPGMRFLPVSCPQKKARRQAVIPPLRASRTDGTGRNPAENLKKSEEGGRGAGHFSTFIVYCL
jgi:hypothetical protein